MVEVAQNSTSRDRKDSNRRSSAVVKRESNGDGVDVQKVSPLNRKKSVTSAPVEQEAGGTDSPKKRRKVNHGRQLMPFFENQDMAC
jgi:hypothetical protein